MAEEGSADRAIGRLEGKLDALIEQGEQSRRSREKMYERLEKLGNDISTVNHRLGDVEDAVKVMDPLVKEFGRLKERGVGILMLLSLIWLLLGGLIVQALSWAFGLLMKAVGGGS
jgi:hypothetical protein